MRTRVSRVWFPIRAIALLIFCPRHFVEGAVNHDIAREFETNKQLREAYPDRQLPGDRRTSLEDSAWDRTRKIRRALGGGFTVVVGTLALGLLSGTLLKYLVGPPWPWMTVLIELLAAGIILGATLAFLGWEIQSWTGRTLPEKVNRWLYRGLYGAGTYLLVLALTW